MFAGMPAVGRAEKDGGLGHVVLLGDSILDNKKYVDDDPAVIDQLRADLPEGWKATLLAVDGSVAADIRKQLAGLPNDATHLVLSVGGNDALRASSILTMQAGSGADVFLQVSKTQSAFRREYSSAIDFVLKAAKPLAVCTVYNPNFPVDTMQRMAEAGLAVFNDVIGQVAARRGLPVLDLRELFTERADFANTIEPSAIGGKKIVEHVRIIVTEHDFSAGQSTWYPKPVE
ncbi:MAG TPA: SGNH/GDSL hydrolase family protein [Pirellulales bacterium]|jgi:lysophospholipase L1-like esterase|nr:SGNH/GDSL hydrolase family protein [Pirellulales bacterium]